MSLIYQALKQTERQASAPLVAGVKPAAAPVAASTAPVPSGFQKPLWLGGLVAAAGVAAGTFLALGGRTAAPPPVAAPVPPAPTVAMPSAAPASAVRPAAATPLPTVAASASALPRAAQQPLPAAEPPLPTAGPKLAMAYGMAPPAAKPPAMPKADKRPVAPSDAANAPRPEPSVAPAPAPVATPAAAAAVAVSPVAPVRSEPVVSVASPRAVTGSAEPEDLGELFDALNRALAAKDEAQSQRLLRAVQARLPESATARWRAEAWYAYQTADMDRARRAYRRLLEKVPGDENATLTLAAIERQQQRPDQAREVLSRSLRQNPNSPALRSALDQLNQSEAAR